MINVIEGYFGIKSTESFENMCDCVFNANWYDLPVELQKYFILMIMNIQKPIYYHGFGVSILNLNTFVQLLRAVVTYYMMFQTIVVA